MKKEDIRIPVSSGELIDKISILKIKRKKIVNKSKLQNISYNKPATKDLKTLFDTFLFLGLPTILYIYEYN